MTAAPSVVRVRRVLVLRALGLGDLCTAVPALRGLRAAFPGAHLQLATSTWLAPVVAMLGVVDEHVPVDGLVPLPPTVWHADLAVNLHGRGPRSTGLLHWTRPAELIGFDGDGGVPWRPGEHEVLRWCRLLDGHGIHCDPADLAFEPPVRTRRGAVTEGAALLHVGASAAARRWPPDRWAQLAVALRGAGVEVIVTGVGADEETAVAVGAAVPGAHLLVGRTDLDALVRLVATARLVVCGDTGMAHLATALRVPSVVLFGPTSPAEWGPRQGPHTTLWAGERGDPHGRTTDAGLLRLTVEDVVRAVEWRLVAAAARRRGGSPSI